MGREPVNPSHAAEHAMGSAGYLLGVWDLPVCAEGKLALSAYYARLNLGNRLQGVWGSCATQKWVEGRGFIHGKARRL